MGKKIYLAIITVITICCVMAGLIMNLNLFSSKGWSIFKNSKQTSYNNVEANQTLDAFSKIDVDLSMGNVQIKTGTDYMIDYSYPDFMKVIVTNENGVLKVNDKSSTFSFNHFNFIGGEVIITVPGDAKIDNITTNCDMGNVEIYDVQAGFMTADVDMGNYETHDITAETMDVDCDMGNVEIYGTVNKVTADCDMGNIAVSLENYDDAVLDLDADMGNVDINGKSQGKSFHK